MNESMSVKPPTIEEQRIMSLAMKINEQCGHHNLNTAISALLACLCSAVEALEPAYRSIVVDGVKNSLNRYTFQINDTQYEHKSSNGGH